MKLIMRINLQVTYSEKDQAKALGARWDAGKRAWYIVDPEDLKPFERWLGKYALDRREDLPNKKHGQRNFSREKQPAKNGPFVTIGKHYQDVPHPDGLLPWEDEDPPELIRLVRDIGYRPANTDVARAGQVKALAFTLG